MLDMRRSLGQYSTPIQTADYMVERLLSFFPRSDQIRILDPAVGDGVFIESLVSHGVAPESLLAFDIDPLVERNLKELPVTYRHQDFLTADVQFDAIIGNPPYKSKRESDYIKTHRGRLEEQFKDTGIQNMYSMFSVHALRSLREGGVLCFVVQDSFLTNVYYQRFREYILTYGLIHEITLCPRRLFHRKDADVRAAILIVEKCTGADNALRRENHAMKLVDRLADETQYQTPPATKVQYIRQKEFLEMEHYRFFINVPEQMIRLIRDCQVRLGDVVDGGTGISTGKDSKFLRKVVGCDGDESGRAISGWDETQGDGSQRDRSLGDKLQGVIARGLVEREDMARGNEPREDLSGWVPFYKNGGAKDAWYYETPYRIHRDWKTPGRQHKDFMTRNSNFYFREGITCSSMGIEFSAAYLPPGCLFGVNANFFTDSREQLFYVLGLLNSLLVKYLLRAVYNRTNMVTAGYIKRLPYIEPAPALKEQVAQFAEAIVEAKKKDSNFVAGSMQDTIDSLIFEVYGISEDNQTVVRAFCENMFESI